MSRCDSDNDSFKSANDGWNNTTPDADSKFSAHEEAVCCAKDLRTTMSQLSSHSTGEISRFSKNPMSGKTPPMASLVTLSMTKRSRIMTKPFLSVPIISSTK